MLFELGDPPWGIAHHQQLLIIHLGVSVWLLSAENNKGNLQQFTPDRQDGSVVSPSYGESLEEVLELTLGSSGTV